MTVLYEGATYLWLYTIGNTLPSNKGGIPLSGKNLCSISTCFGDIGVVGFDLGSNGGGQLLRSIFS